MPASKSTTASKAKSRRNSLLHTETFVFIIILSSVAVLIPALYFTSPAQLLGRGKSPISPPSHSSASRRPPLSLESAREFYNQIIPYLRYARSIVSQLTPYLLAVPSFLIYLTRSSYHLTLRLIQPALYCLYLTFLLFAPIIVLFQTALTTLVLTPYNYAMWLAELVYPIYVFCGIACLVGGGLGVGAALLPQAIFRVIAEVRKARQPEEEEEPVTFRRRAEGSRASRWDHM